MVYFQVKWYISADGPLPSSKFKKVAFEKSESLKMNMHSGLQVSLKLVKENCTTGTLIGQDGGERNEMK